MNLKKYDHFTTTPGFYSGYELLSKTDKNGTKPEIYAALTNRSAGKSTFFNGYLVRKYIRTGQKFILLYRNKYEVDRAADGFFNDISTLFYPDLAMDQQTGVKNGFDILRIGLKSDEKKEHFEVCGFATSLAASELVKRYSHLLSDAGIILMDELFPENGVYLKDEIRRFMSIHDSLSRGHYQHSKYLPVIMVGNLIDLFNPYFDALGIVDSLLLDSHFTRGDGFVIEQDFNEASAQAHKESSFHRALSGADYAAASQEKVYLNTDYDMIDNSVCDIGRYILTIRYNGSLYSVRYNEQGFFYYISDRPDPSFALQHAATEKDITEQAIYNPASPYRKMIKDKYRHNLCKFRNLRCKSAAMHFIAGK
jgi:hypothetical protein